MVTQRIYRSRTDHMLSGVCGGLGQYFAIDSTLIRLSFVVGTILTSGVLILLYAVMWLIIPEEPRSQSGTTTGFGGTSSFETGSFETGSFETSAAEPAGEPVGKPDPFESLGSTFGSGGSIGFTSPRDLSDQRARRHRYLGWLMVVLGVVVLSTNLHLLSWLQLGVTWPIFLVLAGMVLLFRQRTIR